MNRYLWPIIEGRDPNDPEPEVPAAEPAYVVTERPHPGPHSWSLTYSQALQQLEANFSELRMRGQRLGPFPDIVLYQLFHGRLSQPACQLQCLDLSDTGICGHKDFAECFRGNTRLTELYLENNYIGDEGATNLASALSDTCVIHASIRTNLVPVSSEAMQHFHFTITQNRLPTVPITLRAFARPPHPRLYVTASNLAGECWDVRYALPHQDLQDFAATSAVRLREYYKYKAGVVKLVFIHDDGTPVTQMHGMLVSALLCGTQQQVVNRPQADVIP